ncbi:precorrin-2 dehydrogenase/sirohydrochlorin ferrochelatase family protein [Hippea sp. KM1]|uniref:precorrin-2 dehydrogenase/sirohydrochlorin ferrochelatase family protein n=1 Tax=Hippea sp. KM1 TaxID=944481 RepID=UPI00046D0AEC|nr:bifunctional precorrin-2 dehydrogenase/sirohydrochlorin ferrochelatase [Hippea sp. KM1]
MCHPFVFKIKNKNILFVGGGKIALRKLKPLLKKQPNITLISPAIHHKIEAMAKEGKLKIVKRPFEETDITKQWDFVFACTDNHQLNTRIALMCKELSIPVNVASSKDMCDFYIAAVIEKELYSIAITTYGKDPTLSKRIKEKIEKALNNIT